MPENSSTLNFISFGDFWLRFDNNVISFGSSKVDPDIHYTISLSPNSEYCNFHITKNTEDKNNKPKIEIVRLRKNELEERLIRVAMHLIRLSLVPLPIKSLKRRYHNSLWYLPHPLPGSPLESDWHNRISSFAVEHGKKTSRRLKFHADIGDLIQRFTESNLEPDFVFEDIQRVSLRYTPGRPYTEAGVIIAGRKAISILRIGKKWYKWELLKDTIIDQIMNKDAYRMIQERFYTAFEIIRTAKSYEDTHHLNPAPPLSLKDIFTIE